MSDEQSSLSIVTQDQPSAIQNTILKGDDASTQHPPVSETDNNVVGCRCEMSVTGVSNDNPTTHKWDIADQTGAGVMTISGRNNTILLSEDLYGPMPSDFFELRAPSDGSHMFYLTSGTESQPSSNFAVHTTVKCYDQLSNGTEILGTTTYHDFTWSDGTLGGGSGFGAWYVIIWKTFSCTWLTGK